MSSAKALAEAALTVTTDNRDTNLRSKRPEKEAADMVLQGRLLQAIHDQYGDAPPDIFIGLHNPLGGYQTDYAGTGEYTVYLPNGSDAAQTEFIHRVLTYFGTYNDAASTEDALVYQF